ncbi:hypothetical protein WJX73_003313 [Symbiochloris irregularis]|uniref:Uncharacterized protein n=1 Tax=Symbiochloris irregularis TaxID=706552 RepID=A0AAW1PWF0_9CHLO
MASAAVAQTPAFFSPKIQTYFDKVANHDLGTSTSTPNGSTSDIKTSKQGNVIPHTIIEGPADWTSTSLAGKESTYTYTFTDSDTKELIRAVDKLKSRGVASEEDVKNLTKADYDLPTLIPKLLEIGKEVSLGRGFHLIRGFPVESFKNDRLGLVLAFWGLGIVLGRPLVSQTDYNEKGETFGSLLNHVSVGRHSHFKTNPTLPQPKQGENVPRGRDLSRLPFHSDQGATDLIALVSLTNAKRGGESKWVSGVAIHNELLRRGRKDLVEVLSDPKQWNTPRKLDQSAYERNADGTFAGYEPTPPFEYHDGYLTVHYSVGNYLELDLTPIQEEAIWTFARLAEDPKFHFSQILSPGTIEVIHNPTILHSRGDVEDGETNDQKRHLLRWWISQPKEQNPRPVAPSFAPRSLVQPGGGFRVTKGSTVRLPFFPYTRNDGEGAYLDKRAPVDDAESKKVLSRFLEVVDGSEHALLDSADVYGQGQNERLVGTAIKGNRTHYFLSSKFANTFEGGPKSDKGVDGRPDYIRQAVEQSLKRLETDSIDLYYQHRVDRTIPIEETWKVLKELVKEGKVKYLGISEASAKEIRRAHAVHPITALQLEYSLWARDCEKDILPTARELGIGIVAFSPLGRGLFTGTITDLSVLDDNDMRVKNQPRWEKENLTKNLLLVEEVKRLAAKKGVTPGQLSIAWVHHQGDDVFPIPGTKRLKYLEENVAAFNVKLSRAELDELEAVFEGKVHGNRYNAEGMKKAAYGGL